MIASGAVRPALAGLLTVVTFGAGNIAGAFAALNDQNQQVLAAQAAIDVAKMAFDAQVRGSLDDGTPHTAVDPLVTQEKRLQAQPLPSASFFIDQQRLDAMHQRAAKLTALKKQIAGVETQVQVDLHQQLQAALNAMAGDVKPAADAGVDTAEYRKFVDDTGSSNQALKTPAETQRVIDVVKAKDAALKDATAQKIAENQALQAAQADAKQSVAAAQAALQKAQAIPVLHLGDIPAAIASLVDRLSKTTALADLQDIAAAAKARSLALNTLLGARQSAYDLLAETQRHLGLAKAANKDVAQDSANLDAAARALDGAGDLPGILAAKGMIQAVKNDVDSKYFAAVYGQGKVIVVSLAKQEMVALQDGVVLQDTIVTTGRPALPTPPGVYHIFYKSSPYHMHSPWPPGNQYWYPDVDMNWAMEFLDGGYFLHDAPWRRHFGPGSDTENGGTHGCINVPGGLMGWLYNWADMGTPVVVLQGDFGSPT